MYPAVARDRESSTWTLEPLNLAEARAIVAEFRSTRNGYRGSLAAPVSALGHGPDRIAQAILTCLDDLGDVPSSGSDPSRRARRELAEDLVDLASFRPDPEAELLRNYTPLRATGLRPASEEPVAGSQWLLDAQLAYERLTAARAETVHWVRGDIGLSAAAGAAIGGLERPVKIGDARGALDAAQNYRESQAIWLIGLTGWAIGSAFVIFGLDPPPLVTVMLIVGWFFLSPMVSWLLFRLLLVVLPTYLPAAVGYLLLAVVLGVHAAAAGVVALVGWWADGFLTVTIQNSPFP